MFYNIFDVEVQPLYINILKLLIYLHGRSILYIFVIKQSNDISIQIFFKTNFNIIKITNKSI